MVDAVHTEVRDCEKGISPERLAEIQLHSSGVGLRGIRERLGQFQGEMKIECSVSVQLYSLLSKSQSFNNPLGRNFKRYEREEETRVLAESFGAVTTLDKLKIEPRHLGIYFTRNNSAECLRSHIDYNSRI
jgi:hypothetical protein